MDAIRAVRFWRYRSSSSGLTLPVASRWSAARSSLTFSRDARVVNRPRRTPVMTFAVCHCSPRIRFINFSSRWGNTFAVLHFGLGLPQNPGVGHLRLSSSLHTGASPVTVLPSMRFCWRWGRAEEATRFRSDRHLGSQDETTPLWLNYSHKAWQPAKDQIYTSGCPTLYSSHHRV